MLEAVRGLIAWTPMGLPAFLFVITLVVFFHGHGGSDEQVRVVRRAPLA